VFDSFDQMGLHENLLRGIYAYGAFFSHRWFPPARRRRRAPAIPRDRRAPCRRPQLRLPSLRAPGAFSLAPPPPPPPPFLRLSFLSHATPSHFSHETNPPSLSGGFCRRRRLKTTDKRAPPSFETTNPQNQNTGFEKPSAIQQKGIVPFTKGIDVIQQAQSGTGKTATFCAGILNNLEVAATPVECQALVLAPTRELAQQIEKVMRALGDYLQVKCHACVGGTSVREDARILGAGVHVVVGTPGRVYDMLRRRCLRADGIKVGPFFWSAASSLVVVG